MPKELTDKQDNYKGGTLDSAKTREASNKKSEESSQVSPAELPKRAKRKKITWI